MLKSMLSLTLALRSAALVPRAAQHPRRATIRMMSDEKVADFSKIDLRVGTIVSAWNHPDSDKLIVEEIDIGEDEPRQIVSGLRAFYEADALAGKKCVVVANLPKAKLGGVDSFGMVLCGSKDEKAVVEILEPPAEAEDGERAFVDGADGDAATAHRGVPRPRRWSRDLETHERSSPSCLVGEPGQEEEVLAARRREARHGGGRRDLRRPGHLHVRGALHVPVHRRGRIVVEDHGRAACVTMMSAAGFFRRESRS